MTSSEQEGTATAAEQFGSIAHLLCCCLLCFVLALGISRGMERKIDRPEDEKDETQVGKNETPAKFCSSCGKGSDTLKKCNGCKCVWYCDKDCQKRHHGEHKKECTPIKKALAKRGGKLDLGSEKDLGPLPDLSPQEECPICMRVLPIHAVLQMYKACCGKTICAGCQLQHQVKSGKRAECAFCKTTLPKTDDEELAQLRKRVEIKDPSATFSMSMKYGYGKHGLPVDQAKCIDLLRESAGLGFSVNQYQLGIFHHDGAMGLEQNKEEALEYWGKAAEGGHILARHNLGYIKYANGDHVAAMRHCRLSASVGYRHSMDILIIYFERGLLHHEDLANTLQAMYYARAEMESKGRDEYFAYLRKTGEYHEEYEY